MRLMNWKKKQDVMPARNLDIGIGSIQRKIQGAKIDGKTTIERPTLAKYHPGSN